MATIIMEKDNIFKEINMFEPAKSIIDFPKIPFCQTGIIKKQLEEYFYYLECQLL